MTVVLAVLFRGRRPLPADPRRPARQRPALPGARLPPGQVRLPAQDARRPQDATRAPSAAPGDEAGAPRARPAPTRRTSTGPEPRRAARSGDGAMSCVIAIDAGTTGIRSRAVHMDGRPGLSVVPGVHPALPAARLGRARRRRDLGRGAGDARRGRRAGRSRRHRGDRHHEPARDRPGLGPRDGPAVRTGDRVAGPAHGRPLRRAGRRRRPRPRALPHRPRARPVLQRHEVRVAAAGGRRADDPGPRARHHRRLDRVEPHRW